MLEGANSPARDRIETITPRLKKGAGYVHLPVVLGGDGDIDRPTSSRSADRPAVFLDRDGVLVEDVGFLRRPEDLRILPGVTKGLRSLAFRFQLVVVTNQSGIARGLFSEDDLLDIHQELDMGLAMEDVAIDAYYYCPHLPDGAVSKYSVDCECRKPKPGMLQQASSDLGISLGDSYMIGDNPRDVISGLAAGSKGVIIGESSTGCPDSVVIASGLLEAAGLILADLPESDGPRSGVAAGSAAHTPKLTREKLPCRL